MRLALSILIILLCGLTASGRIPRPILGDVAEMHAERVPLVFDDPSRVRVGALTYLGGVRLTSPDPAFGGFSAISVEGDRFTLLSDGGNVVRFRMGADWTPRAVAFGDLLEGPGRETAKSNRDTESLAVDGAGGHAWVGFESRNVIVRYDAALTHLQQLAAPDAMHDWSRNGGPEAMARLASGEFVVISETSRPRGDRPARIGLRFAGDPVVPGQRAAAFAYVPPAGYDPSDAVQLPDGRLLVLNRSVGLTEGFTAKLVLLDTRAIREGARVRGTEIATLAQPVLHDNFEALAAVREGDSTILWIASDDNNLSLQRSLLLKFRLEIASPAPKAAKVR